MISGIGLHSGAPCKVLLHRAEGPVRFRRNGQEILAHVSRVVDTARCTTLGYGPLRISMVEHLLAALHVLGWWRGLVIEVSGEELPILDGSAEPWLAELDGLGSPPPAPAPFTLARRASYRLDESELVFQPGAPALCAEIDFAHPAIGRQRWCGTAEVYCDLLNARTFGFLHELETLKAMGLATAASLENAIVFGSEEPLQQLRHPDEPVRHKALDALGDLFLLGRPPAGNILVKRGSHRSHIAFVYELLRLEQNNVNNNGGNNSVKVDPS